jgi:hypothetical protein
LRMVPVDPAKLVEWFLSIGGLVDCFGYHSLRSPAL